MVMVMVRHSRRPGRLSSGNGNGNDSGNGSGDGNVNCFPNKYENHEL